MDFIRKLLVKFLLGNKEAIIGVALTEFAKLWAKGKKQLVAKIVDVVKQSPLAETATDEEIGGIFVALEAWFDVPQFDAVVAAVGAAFKK